MHRTAALLLTLLALTFQLSALADMGLMDRAEACGRVATIYCRAYARCASICPGCEVSTTEKVLGRRPAGAQGGRRGGCGAVPRRRQRRARQGGVYGPDGGA
jgi:hypothetical protein